MSSENNSKSKEDINLPLKCNDTLTKIIEDSDFEEKLSSISLKYLKNPKTIFIQEKFSLEKEKNSSLKSCEIIKKLSKEWKEIPEEEKKKYIKLSEEEKEKYKKDFESARQFFLNEFKYKYSCYRIFLYYRLIDFFVNNKKLKEIKVEANKEWNKLTKEEKLQWKTKNIEKISWIEKIINTNYINGYVVFVHKIIHEFKEKEEQISFQICANLWRKLPINEKNKYEEFAEEINLEKLKKRELFEIINGIQPKKPAGAFKIFLSEKVKKEELKTNNILKEGINLWEKLSKEEKDEYLQKAKKIKLCYIYMKMIHKKKLKRIIPSKPKSAFHFFVESNKDKIPENNENFFEMCKRLWNEISENEKEKYNKLADEELKKYEEKMEKYKNRIFNTPKSPKNSFQLYFIERMEHIKEENKDLNDSNYIKMILKEWENLDEEKKKIYEEHAKVEQKRFKVQNKEFNEFGYYTEKNGNEKEKENQSIGRLSERKSENNIKSVK